MARKDVTSAVIDNILRYLAAGGVIMIGLAVPNVLQILDKPLTRYLSELDRKARDREVTRVLRYMREHKLISYKADNYNHGIEITTQGAKRAQSANLNKLRIKKLKTWDKTWRIVMFDIPESHKSGRDALSGMLKRLGFHKLQKSVWLHPYPCRDEVMTISGQYKINKFVTYIETSHIDHEDILVNKFKL